MSVWKSVPKENIELDGDEINVLISSDRNGNMYITLKTKDIEDLLQKPNPLPPPIKDFKPDLPKLKKLAKNIRKIDKEQEG